MLPLLIAGAALSAYGAYKGAEADREEGEAKLAYYNALADNFVNQGKDALIQADNQVKGENFDASIQNHKLVQDQRGLAATQAATMAGNGVWGNSTTAEDITRDTFNRQKEDQLLLKYNAESKAAAIRDAGQRQYYDLLNQARFARMGGQQAYDAGQRRSTATLLSGAGSLAMSGAGYMGQGYGSSKISYADASAGRSFNDAVPNGRMYG